MPAFPTSCRKCFASLPDHHFPFAGHGQQARDLVDLLPSPQQPVLCPFPHESNSQHWPGQDSAQQLASEISPVGTHSLCPLYAHPNRALRQGRGTTCKCAPLRLTLSSKKRNAKQGIARRMRKPQEGFTLGFKTVPKYCSVQEHRKTTL